MAFLQVNYYSKFLGKESMMNVILPERDGHNPNRTAKQLSDIPVLYLLHGMGNDFSAWSRRTNIERLVRLTDLAIVMPDTDLGWYTNTASGLKYFDATSKELFEKVALMFPQISKKVEKHFIAGVSMGGYGAFKMALATDYFSYAASLSGALTLDFSYPQVFQMAPQAYWEGIFGNLDDFHESENDLLTLAEKRIDDKKTLPKLYAWIGQQDFLLPANEYAVPKLKALGYDLTYKTDPGRHEWYYWNKQIENVLEWLPIKYIKEERLS